MIVFTGCVYRQRKRGPLPLSAEYSSLYQHAEVCISAWHCLINRRLAWTVYNMALLNCFGTQTRQRLREQGTIREENLSTKCRVVLYKPRIRTSNRKCAIPKFFWRYQTLHIRLRNCTLKQRHNAFISERNARHNLPQWMVVGGIVVGIVGIRAGQSGVPIRQQLFLFSNASRRLLGSIQALQ